MTSAVYLHHIWKIIVVAMLAFVALAPTMGFAQDSIAELDARKNAAGYDRTNGAGRVFAEIGMGLVGEITLAVPCALVGLGGAAFMNEYAFFGAMGLFELAVTPLTAEFVNIGGRLTGGRAKRWPVYVGGYVGFGTAIAMGLFGFLNEKMIYVGLIAIPVLSLVGSVVGYELSDRHETNRLRSERDKLMRNSAPLRSRPIMITLYSGQF